MKDRSSPLEAGSSGLLVIDLQEAFVRRGRGMFADPDPKRWPPAKLEAYFAAVEGRVLPNARRLARAFRAARQEVLFTVIQSLTKDGRDRSLDHKLSHFHIPKGDPGGRVPPELEPGEDEIVLPKSASGVFNATNMEYLLRNLGIGDLVLCGVFTDQCVESAVRDAADRGFYVTLVGDACAGTTPEAHANSLAAMAAYGRVRTTDEILGELAAMKGQAA
jgi:nicotinamidase-related amidase